MDAIRVVDGLVALEEILEVPAVRMPFVEASHLAASMAASNSTAMLIAAGVGGLIGAAILFTAYFIGVTLVGAGLGAVVANMAFAAAGSQPRFLVVVLCSIAGAAAATYLQRWFIIVGTGFGGAWTMLVGLLAVLGDKKAMRVGVAAPDGRPGCLDEHRFQPRRTVADPRGAALACTLIVLRAEPGPGDQMSGTGEAAHLQPDFGDHDRG